ncbi:hypothetical protein GCM10020000_43660 [Streptomyces olivoverticillatus]
MWVRRGPGFGRPGRAAPTTMVVQVSLVSISSLRLMRMRSRYGSPRRTRSRRNMCPVIGHGPDRSVRSGIGCVSASRMSRPIVLIPADASVLEIDRPCRGLNVGRSVSVALRAERIRSASSAPSDADRVGLQPGEVLAEVFVEEGLEAGGEYGGPAGGRVRYCGWHQGRLQGGFPARKCRGARTRRRRKEKNRLRRVRARHRYRPGLVPDVPGTLLEAGLALLEERHLTADRDTRIAYGSKELRHRSSLLPCSSAHRTGAPDTAIGAPPWG